MSVQVQVYKCANVGCENPIPKEIKTNSLKRFCQLCRFKYNHGKISANLIWKCRGCGSILSGNVLRLVCNSCKKKRIARQNKITLRRMRLRLKEKCKCLRCGGRLGRQSYNTRYCTAYCKWLNYTLNHNIGLKRKMEQLI